MIKECVAVTNFSDGIDGLYCGLRPSTALGLVAFSGDFLSANGAIVGLRASLSVY
jgi:UDP-N-acetylmuramyl pentapeptide phosphotransferase/UDP-N-acetylglucosamine-1-phosphate transferase